MGKCKVMPGRNLKHYDSYLQKLELYAKACRIKIIYTENGDEGSFTPQTRKIRIDPNLSPSYEIAILLHELGHSLDDTLVPKVTESRLDKAYKAIYKSKYTQRDLQIVIECEKRAWNYGRAIAKRLQIKLGKWYDEARQDCLSSYKEQ